MASAKDAVRVAFWFCGVPLRFACWLRILEWVLNVVLPQGRRTFTFTHLG